MHKRNHESWHDADDWQELTIRLVGLHPLWGQHLWNAARSFARFLDTHASIYCRGATVLELGAGGGLPGLVATLSGATRVLLTDYPDEPLLNNLRINVEANVPEAARHTAQVLGFIWGQDPQRLLHAVPTGYDLIILSDVIFNHSQHDALLKTCEETIAKRITDPKCALESQGVGYLPCVLVFYTHHRPHLASRDMDFFLKADERGWTCEKIVTERMHASDCSSTDTCSTMTQAMFPDDPGDEDMRATVHGWRLRR